MKKGSGIKKGGDQLMEPQTKKNKPPSDLKVIVETLPS